ncbi:uncharacterized protein LOC131243491 isoform X3 [Magnolia sinica]|uniref:uncharacterized protein LOC131243491 isoform X3 n=1 Tax=Magnolia sinica TaxID=86752 RepID=UPI0026593C86|nr:uncharacterized protein LOC131243491 isoform X3 [Magnolia sinica]
MSMTIDALPPLIHAQLNYLLTHSPLSVKVDRVWSGGKNSRYCDRFTLLIPFCLDYIKWDVMYNALYPLGAPDIIFAPEDEDFHPLLMIAEGGEIQTAKSTLSDWNSKDPKRLLSLVHELRDLYMSYQRKRVGGVDDARLKFELSTILSREPEEVKFAVPLLDMDLNKLVHGCPWRHQQKIYLQVVFPVIRKYSSAPSAPRVKLVSSSELKTLFSIEDIKLPPWIDGMCMAEYLPNLEENLKAQLLEAVASVGARRRFIEALAPHFGRPVEADPESHSSCCFWGFYISGKNLLAFVILPDSEVHFLLPTQFPKQQPTLMLQSSQHFNSQGTPVMSPPLTDYPWSPRWETSLMVERIFEFLVDECLNFKKYCNDTLLPQH